MIRYKEESKTNAVDFASKIEDEIKKIFPKSYVQVDFSNRLGTSIIISFALGKDKSEWAHGIIQNDPARMNLFIYGTHS